MFENDYTINGKHATYMKYLVNDAKIFDRYIDVYMNAAIWGMLYGRISERDSSTDRARVYADAFAKERENCMFIYRLIMLLDNTKHLLPNERIDRAFRDDAQDGDSAKASNNLDLFHSYVLGGIEVLYERYVDGCTTQEDYLTRIYDLMTTFKKDIAGATYEKELEKLKHE
ncbi:hypothetical protein JW979_15625 [bacterium]|nr:hypothetical protein [candidate division CSSED10-310 bacterium]